MLCAAAAIAYISRNSLAVPADAISAELGMSKVDMGWVMGAFFWSYALAQIPSGALGQRWGTRRTLAFLAVLWSLAIGLTGLATGFWSFVLARLVFGVAQAGIFPCAANTVSKWFPASERGLPTGALGSFMSIGGALGIALTGFMIAGAEWGDFKIPGMSWRTAFALMAAPGIVWAMFFYYWFRDRPEEHRAVNRAELELIRTNETPTDETSVDGTPANETKAPAAATPWLPILTSFSMWMICGQQFFRAAGYIFFATWFPSYLQESRGVTLAASGLLASLPLLANVAGCAVGGVMLDWVWRRTKSLRWSRQRLAIAAMLGCAACTLAAYFVVETLPAVIMISLGSFLAGFGGPIAYTTTIDKGGQHVAPVFGMMNMSGNLGAALCPVVVGMLFDLDIVDGVLVMFAGVYLLAAICWAFLNPQGTIFDDV